MDTETYESSNCDTVEEPYGQDFSDDEDYEYIGSEYAAEESEDSDLMD